MAPSKSLFTLKTKTALTHNVFELVFECEHDQEVLPGQFVMFFLASGLRRSYSIAYKTGTYYTFIIKQLEGGAGSTEICTLPLESTITGMTPLGHFTLVETDKKVCWIGTGTGFAPLYFQLRSAIESGFSNSASFIFGVRNTSDLFYQETLAQLAQNHKNLNVSLYLSQDDSAGTTRGYVTDAITPELVVQHDIFCLCGSPAMVQSAREKLTACGATQEQIRFEQY